MESAFPSSSAWRFTQRFNGGSLPELDPDPANATEPATSLKHGESIRQLQRTIHLYATGSKRGHSHDEQRAVSASLTLLSNLVMAWNTSRIQPLADLAVHRWGDISMEDIAAVGPVGALHINFRGMLHSPLKEFADPILQAPAAIPTAP